MSSYVIVLTTFASESDAESLTGKLLDAHLIACANIVHPVRSMFLWKGARSGEQEALAIIKTRKKLLPAVIKWIRENHPYEVPEILALPVLTGSREYLDWIEEETSDAWSAE